MDSENTKPMSEMPPELVMEVMLQASTAMEDKNYSKVLQLLSKVEDYRRSVEADPNVASLIDRFDAQAKAALEKTPPPRQFGILRKRDKSSSHRRPRSGLLSGIRRGISRDEE